MCCLGCSIVLAPAAESVGRWGVRGFPRAFRVAVFQLNRVCVHSSSTLLERQRLLGVPVTLFGFGLRAWNAIALYSEACPLFRRVGSLVVAFGFVHGSTAPIFIGEFDPGSGRTLAACLKNASRTGGFGP